MTAAPKPTCCSPARGGSPCTGDAIKAREAEGPARVKVLGGLALLGTDAPVLAVDEEGPLRRAKVKPFAIDTTAVTNARFGNFVDATGYTTDAERFGDSFVFVGHLPPDKAEPMRAVADAPWWRAIPGTHWRAPLGPGSDAACLPDHPVTHVSWADARAFAQWAGGRLPTEAEWEHAARGGLGDVPYPWGSEAPTDDGPFRCNIWQGTFPDRDLARDGYTGTAPAQSFAPNGYGLFNMVGNVWEWTATPFKLRSLKRSAAQAHAGKAGWKVSKGGSYLCHASYCFRYRIAARSATSPDSSTSHQGFRLAYPVSA